MALARFFRRSQPLDSAYRLYGQVVEQARHPVFYRDYGVPDTLDGRFDMILLHAVLVLRRLRLEGEKGRALGQALFDVMMADMDRSLREMGVGDLGVGKRVGAMARAFHGRAAAYERAFAAGDGALAETVRRNVFGTVEPRADNVTAVAEYARGAAAALDTRPGANVLAGEVSFGRPPERTAPSV